MIFITGKASAGVLPGNSSPSESITDAKIADLGLLG
jgi:hypothetical protein